MSEAESHGFMPKGDWQHPVSRDWAEVDCQAISCVYNKSEKCSVPSLAKIGEDGKCKGFSLGTYGDVKPGEAQ